MLMNTYMQEFHSLKLFMLETASTASHAASFHGLECGQCPKHCLAGKCRYKLTYLQFTHLAHSIRAFEAAVPWKSEQLFSKKTVYFSSFPSG